jgi:hypothetical protein
MPRGGGNVAPRAVKDRLEQRLKREEAEKETARRAEEAAKEAARRSKQLRKAMENMPNIAILARHGISGTPEEMKAAHRRFMLANHPDKADSRGDTPQQKKRKRRPIQTST